MTDTAEIPFEDLTPDEQIAALKALVDAQGAELAKLADLPARAAAQQKVVNWFEEEFAKLAPRVTELETTKLDAHAAGVLATSIDLRLQEGIRVAATTVDGVDEDLKPLPPMPAAGKGGKG